MSILPIDTSPFFMERLKMLVDLLIQDPYSEPFRSPVNWKVLKIPDYPKIIQYPMDLGTIKKKLEDNIYSIVQEVLYDLDAIWLNCYKYNGSNSDISRLAKALQNKCTDELDQIYNDYYELQLEHCRNLKTVIMKSIEQSTPSQYKVLIPWFESIGIVKERKRDELHVDLDLLKPKDFDELVRYFGLSCLEKDLTMGCIPSKTDNVNKDVNTSLLSSEQLPHAEPHPVQTYEVSSSEEEIRTLPMDRKNTSQYATAIMNKLSQELIDVPSLAYTLYGTNSPYNYCEEYNDIIMSSHIVDGVMAISILPEIDSSLSTEELLSNPNTVDSKKLDQCAKDLKAIVNSMKISDDSLIVEF